MKRLLTLILLTIVLSSAAQTSGRLEFDMFSPYMSVDEPHRWGTELGASFRVAQEERVCFGLGAYLMIGTDDGPDDGEIGAYVPFCASARVIKNLNVRAMAGPAVTSDVGMVSKFRFDVQYFVSRTMEGSVPLGVYLTIGPTILVEEETDVQVQVGIGITIF